MSSKVTVLLTVPHGTGCTEYQYNSHPCDSDAELMARDLQAAIKAQGLDYSSILVSETPRSRVDMNRIVGRDTSYRRHLSSLIKDKLQGHSVWVIDVHSYPPEHHWDSRNLDFYVLDTQSSGQTTSYVSALESLMGGDIGVISGGENDIMNTSRELGARSFLIETKEGIHPGYRRDVANRIVQFISSNKF